MDSRSLGGSVLFLSATDTCIGAMAAELLRNALAKHGVRGVDVISAGTKARDGVPATVEAQNCVEGLHRHLSSRLEDVDLRTVAHA